MNTMPRIKSLQTFLSGLIFSVTCALLVQTALAADPATNQALTGSLPLSAIQPAAPPAISMAPVTLNPFIQQIDVSSNLALFHDPSASLPIREVLKHADEFQVASRKDLARSFNAGAFWLSLEIRNDMGQDFERWLVVGHPRIQHVDLFVLTADGRTWDNARSGTAVARDQKPIQALDPVFPILLKAGQTHRLMIRIHSQTAVDMSAVLWIPEAYRTFAAESKLLLMLVLGGLLLGTFVSFAIFIGHREQPYVWLGLLQLSIVLLEATREGFLPSYLWPSNIPFYSPILLIWGGFSSFAIASIVTSTLPNGMFPRYTLGLIKTIRWASLGLVALGFYHYGWAVRLLSMTTIVLMLLSMVTTFWIYRRGFAPALYLALGLFLTWGIETLRQLANLSALPWAMHLSTSAGLLFATPVILLGLVRRTSDLAEQLVLSHQVDKAKTEFLARINHELRSPLNTIIGFARMLQRESPRLTVHEGTHGIEQHSMRLLSMIDELLDESRLRAGRLSLAPTHLSLADWYANLCATWLINAELAGNQFVAQPFKSLGSDTPCCIVADGQRLRQVLDNLLSNANRHTESGTLELCLSTQASDRADQVILNFAVIDTGQGIAPEHLEKIFEPFYRGTAASTKDPLRRAGFGMGLSITQELLRLMGSELRVSSAPGQGSTFSFSLTCTRCLPTELDCTLQTMASESSANIASSTITKPTAGQKSQPSINHTLPMANPQDLRILIVDDEANARLTLSDTLTSLGYFAESADSGEAAIGMLAAAGSCPNFDLVITDQRMDNGDGWFVLDTLRAEWPDLPVILLSGEAPDPHRTAPTSLNASLCFDAALRKPIEDQVLDRTVKQVISGHRNRQYQQLLSWVNEGEITQIEQWCQRANACPRQLVDKVLAAAHRLDFSAIEILLQNEISSLGKMPHAH